MTRGCRKSGCITFDLETRLTWIPTVSCAKTEGYSFSGPRASPHNPTRPPSRHEDTGLRREADNIYMKSLRPFSAVSAYSDCSGPPVEFCHCAAPTRFEVRPRTSEASCEAVTDSSSLIVRVQCFWPVRPPERLHPTLL